MTPPVIQLARSWAILLGLTSATMAIGTDGGRLFGQAGAAVMMAVALVKVWQILTHYMGLSGTGRRWRNALAGGLIVVCAAVAGLYVAAPPSHPDPTAIGGPGGPE